VSATLTPEEIAEISAFVRAYPEAASQVRGSRDPREALERIRQTLRELNQAPPQTAEVDAVKQPPDRPVPLQREHHRTRRRKRSAGPSAPQQAPSVKGS
jgi:hypothetical protein